MGTTVNRLLVCTVWCACGGAQKPHVADEVRIAVLDAGAQPQAKLVYEPKLHVPERFEVAAKIQWGTSVLDNGRSGLDLPTVVMTVRLEATETLPNGDSVIACAVEDAKLLDDAGDAATRASAQTKLATVKQTRVSWRRSRTGQVVEAAATAERGVGCTFEPVVFPDVPIGVGARWRTSTTRVTSIGGRWNEVTDYSLRELHGSTAIIDVGRTAEAPSQSLGVERQKTATLTSGSGRAAGRYVVSLQRLSATGDEQRVARMTVLLTDHALRATSENEIQLVTIVKALD